MVHDPKSSSRAYSSSRLYTAMPPESAARSALGSVCTAMAVICRGSVRSSGAKIATRPWYSPSEQYYAFFPPESANIAAPAAAHSASDTAPI